MKIIIFLLVLLYNFKSYAFPQMIRHGYNNCMTCHASPRGGGLMTDYGRALSKEVLSTWGYEGEENWHYGALKTTPNWLKVGGDFRAAQVHSKTSQATIGRFIEMQEQVELAAKLKNTWLNITTSSDTTKESRPWYISQFYLLTNLTQSLNVRIGRFIPRFGINTPEHIFSTRGPVGFGYQTERDTVELLYTKSKWDLSVAATYGELRDKSEASGLYSQFNYSFSSHDKVGLSLEKKMKADKALSIGAHALVGFTEKFYLITDTVFKDYETSPGENINGFFHFTKLGYEIEKGIHIIALGDIRKNDLALNSSTESFYGMGLTIFPRPHFEIQGVFTKRRVLSRGPGLGDYAWLMMHFYL